MFDDLQKQPNNQQQENKPTQPIQDVPQQPVAPKEDVSQRIEKLKEKGVKQSRRKKLYLIIGIVVISLFAGGVVGAGYFFWNDIANIINERFNKDTSDELILLDEWKVCSQDLDCVETQKGCCNCANGGIQMAINKQYLDEWQNILDNSCQDVGCLAFVNCKQGRVVCEDNKCAFKEIVEIDRNEDCAKEGKIFSLEYDQEGPDCCEGLNKKAHFDLIDDECAVLLDDMGICINCPNGECGFGENKCNCPEDCEEEFRVDTDNDGLFDDEEAQYGTDINNPDSDGDGYLDGDEVKNGYNPMGEGMLI